MWEVGFVQRSRGEEELEAIDELEALSQEAVGHLISKRQYDFVSPHYDGPILLDVLGVDDPLPQYDHPHRELRESSLSTNQKALPRQIPRSPILVPQRQNTSNG